VTSTVRPEHHAGTSNGCPSGKLGHLTRRGAKAHAYRLKLETGEHLRPYQCEGCGAWHVGHLPGAVIRGRKTADEVYRRGRSA